jgi:thymidine kinase
MLHVIIGCMFSGKTSSLQETFTKFKSSKRVLVLDYDTTNSNTQYTSTLYTHSKLTTPCIKLMNLDIDFLSYDCILINEAQFFKDLDRFVKQALLHKKDVYVYGLDGDFKQEKFGFILDLIPFCDTLTKLYAKCNCGANANFTKRLSVNETQYAPNDTYVPVCRSCLSDSF